MDGDNKTFAIIVTVLTIVIAFAIAVPVGSNAWRQHTKEIAAIEAGLVQCRTIVPGNVGAKTIWVVPGTCPVWEQTIPPVSDR